MPKVKNYEPGADMAPNPDVAWFRRMGKLAGFDSPRQLSLVVMAGEGGEGESGADLLGRVLNGRRRLRAAELVRLAAALNTPVAEVLQKLGFDVNEPRAELAGVLDSRGYILPSEIIGTVPAPYSPRPLSAIVAPTLNPPLAMWSKAFLFFVDATKIAHAHENQLCVLTVAERTERFLGSVKSQTLLTVAGTLEPIETKQILASSPVVHVRFP